MSKWKSLIDCVSWLSHYNKVVLIMNMKKYMTFTVKWEKFIGEDEDTNMPMYAEPVEIKSFVYGKNLFIREDEQHTTVSAKVYLTLEDIHVKDKIDGQQIKSVNHYPENWDNQGQLLEALTWSGWGKSEL